MGRNALKKKKKNIDSKEWKSRALVLKPGSASESLGNLGQLS